MLLHKKEPREKTLLRLLAGTDYKAIKYGEGAMTEEEYEPVKLQRQAWRDEINEIDAGKAATKKEDK
jgi:hypothetical protein